MDDDAAAATLAAAWDSGIRYFDTAPHYGIGQSERRFGAFLRQQPRDAFMLSTKVGRLLVEQDSAGRTDEAFQVPATHRRVADFSRDGVRRCLEESLIRMGLDRVDVLYLHDSEKHFQAALHDGYPALAELRAEGVVAFPLTHPSVTGVVVGMRSAEEVQQNTKDFAVGIPLSYGVI